MSLLNRVVRLERAKPITPPPIAVHFADMYRGETGAEAWAASHPGEPYPEGQNVRIVYLVATEGERPAHQVSAHAISKEQ